MTGHQTFGILQFVRRNLRNVNMLTRFSLPISEQLNYLFFEQLSTFRNMGFARAKSTAAADSARRGHVNSATLGYTLLYSNVLYFTLVTSPLYSPLLHFTPLYSANTNTNTNNHSCVFIYTYIIITMIMILAMYVCMYTYIYTYMYIHMCILFARRGLRIFRPPRRRRRP